MVVINKEKYKNWYKKQFQKLTKEQQEETLTDFKERHSRGFHKTLQIEVLNELLA